MAKKPEGKKAPRRQKPQKKEPEKEGFRGIIRIAGKDVKGELSLIRALSSVKGVGHTVALAASSAIRKELSIDPSTRVGELSEQQMDKVDKILYNLQDYGVPGHVLNRRTDFKAGKDRHVIMNDLLFETSQDVDREKKMYSWRGFRHTFGQKVRGQKTRNTGRSGMAVGVLRKAIIAAQAGKEGAKRGGKAEKEKK